MSHYRYLYALWNYNRLPGKGILAVMLVFFGFLGPVNAQTNAAVNYGFKSDTVLIRAGETFSNTFWVHNAGTEVVTLHPEFTKEQDPALLKLPDTIILQANEKRWFPLKYIADRKTIKKKVQDITVRLRSTNAQIAVQSFSSFYVLPEEIRGLVLDTDEPEIYLNQLTNQATVLLRCYNNSLFPVDFRLDITHVPEGLEFTGKTPNRIQLKPGEQTAIPFTAKNKLQRRVAADFAVTIKAVDIANNQELTQKNVRILSISSDRRLGFNQTTLYQNRPNTIALRYLNINNDFNIYQLQGNGAYTLADSQHISYQVNADYFNNPHQNGINLYDTYLEYQHKKYSFRAGNIYELLDFNINGRGLKGSLKTGQTGLLSIYGLENNYLLYTNFQDLPLSGGNTFAATYRVGDAESNTKSAIALHSTNTWNKTNTTLFSGAANLPLNKKEYIGIEAGYSQLGLEEAHSSTKSGFAIGLKYSRNSARIHISSYNYYSSPYYGGFRRGLLQIDNTLLVALNKQQSVSASVRILNNRPKLMYYTPENSYLSVTNSYGNAIYELGYGFRLGLWSINIRPYYFAQSIQMLEGKERWRSSSYRTKINLNYSYASHNLFLEVDNGYTSQNTSEKPMAPFFSSRINANYKNALFGFNALVQLNSYFITDALALTNDNPRYSYVSAGPNINFALFRQLLLVSANATYNYSGYNNTHTYSLGGNARLRLKNNWALTADGFYGMNIRRNEYNPTAGINPNNDPNDPITIYRYNNQQIRVGIEKSFGSNGNGTEKKLELVYFEDRNSNGYRDRNEPPVNGLLVKSNGITAITNAKGRVKFTGEKDKFYNIAIVNNQSLTLLHPTEVYLKRNMKIEVPLVRTELLTGKVVYVSEKYTNQNPSPAGLRVNAIASGGQIFSTLINDNGDFNLYLPKDNTYTISVETEGMHFKMLTPSQTVKIENNKRNTVLFQYHYKERNIKVTRFD